MKILILISVLFLAACQTTSTKISETTSNLPITKDRGIVLTDKSVVLDARPLFSFSNAHLPQAVAVRWDHFSRPGDPNKGFLDRDTFALARRLARVGVNPDTQVVVVGLGKEGRGEEGRVAWTLAYLGLKNVTFSREDYFESKRIPGEVAATKNVPIWKPVIQKDLMTEPNEFFEIIGKNKGPGSDSILILDVRTGDEYLKRKEAIGEIGAINMDWREFVTEKGRPRHDIAKDLVALGIKPERTIVVVGEFGIRSAAVTMALREMGYKKVSNLAGGLTGLQKARQIKK